MRLSDLCAIRTDENHSGLAYLPKQLSKEELEEIVTRAMDEIGATSMKDMGRIMGVVMPQTKGRADGKMINEIVKAHLS